MMGILGGKVAVITGSGRGIGKACAEVFVREGAQVLAADMSGAEKDTAAELGAAVVPSHTDVSKEDDVAGMIAAALDAFGRVDALLNVAGPKGGRSGGELFDLGNYEVQTDVNLKGVLLCMKHAVPAMLQSGGGSIVNISAATALNVEKRASVTYMAVKAGIVAMTKAVAVEYGPQGIRANVIAPGYTLSDLNRALPAEVLAEMCPKSALGRGGEPREQAEVAAFLASDRASFVTAAVIPVDGGWTAKLA
jgi:NAD(P)-dependent dehydrogenase (short-subunit alcohol dehydrogenase family)